MSTSDDEADERRMQMMDLVHDLGNGFGLLLILAGREDRPLPREAMLTVFSAFDAAYCPAAVLQVKGLLTGPGLLSPETGERITRLGALLRLDPESAEGQSAAAEIRALAEECVKVLLPPEALIPE